MVLDNKFKSSDGVLQDKRNGNLYYPRTGGNFVNIYLFNSDCEFVRVKTVLIKVNALSGAQINQLAKYYVGVGSGAVPSVNTMKGFVKFDAAEIGF